LTALATNYRGSDGLLELLRDRALNDPEWPARRDALTALATNFRDADGLLELLRERAINDPDPAAEAENYSWVNYVRRIAIETIARYWPDHPDTLKLLRERAENDPTEWLRKRAKELADSIEASR
jgi:hypothetical protein